MIKSSTGLSDTIICLLETVEILHTLQKYAERENINFIQMIGGSGGKRDSQERPQSSSTNATNLRKRMMNNDLMNQSHSFDHKGSKETLDNYDDKIMYKGKKYDKFALFQMAERILIAICNSPFAWKGLVPKSIQAMEEFRNQQNTHLLTKVQNNESQESAMNI